MSQFNPPKNPPWVRPDNFSVPQIPQPGIHQPMLNPQMSPVVQYQQSPNQQPTTVYQAQLALQQQALSMQQTMQQNIQQMTNAQQIYNPQINAVATVGGRNLNAAAFAQPVVAPNSGPAPSITNPPPTPATGSKQRVFTGIVTKVLDTYGFVDEDVFFQFSVVKGPIPVVNDRVLVEAVCLPNMPFKWNATRIQVLPMNEAPRNSKKAFMISPSSLDRGNYAAVPPPGEYEEMRRERERDRERRRNRSRERTRNRSPTQSHDEDKKRKERRERDDKDKEREKDRERARTRSPKRSSTRQNFKKYRVQVPEHPLDVPHLCVSDLKVRYHSMYVPSDFFRTSLKWQETFLPHNPMSFSKSVQFHVMSRDVDRLDDYSDELEPPDADYSFCAKVVLLSFPPKDVMMKKCIQLTEDSDKEDGRNLVHPSRLINCLVGANTRTKNEIMAFGGPWSPSLDGPDPVGDPNVLIKTAIRACRALTGIDLTPCTHWYRFVEIYYHRAKSTYKGKQIPARVETVVIYVPDVWSAMPSCLDWEKLQHKLVKQMDKKLVEIGKDQTEAEPGDEKVGSPRSSQKEASHFSHLDPKVMKVSELRDELEARNISSKGLRLQLLARLSKALKTEQEAAEQEQEKIVEKTPAEKEKEKEEERRIKEEKERKRAEQKNRALIEERYSVPESPHILVFPSRSAKGGKFTCKVMSLSLLLDYSVDVCKEHTFEVSLFAELFNEMLMYEFGMQVYRAIYEAPEVEEKDDGEKEKKSERGKEERDDRSAEREKKSEKSEEKKTEKKDEKSEERASEQKKNDQQNVPNGNDEGCHVSSEEDDESGLREGATSNKKEKKEEKKDRKKKETVVPHYTANPELLLAFTYFDVTRYGSITKNHLEELIYTLGLQLSRSQVKRLVDKVISRDYCDYRKLTDLPVGTTLENTPSRPSSPSVVSGNRSLIPSFRLVPKKSEVSSPPSKRSKLSREEDTNWASTTEEGFVYHKGVLVNIESLKEQVYKNETARLKTEEKLTELKQELSHLREKSEKSAEEVRSLERELKSCKAKLEVTTEKLSEQVASSDIYLSALMDIEERLIPILDTDEIRRLIKIRQAVTGAPALNLVPLTKVENISKIDDSEIYSEPSIKQEVIEIKEDLKMENGNEEEKMEVS